MDRDGVINVPAPKGQYIKTWQEFSFIPGIVNWIRLFNSLDFLVIVVTNQRGVARGLIKVEELNNIHYRMKEQLERSGAHIHDILFCPHERNACDCRKPGPAMVLNAMRKWDIDLSESIVIGDSPSDRELAARCGMRFVQVAAGTVEEIVDPQNQLLSKSFATCGVP